jgi:hypothetical protein
MIHDEHMYVLKKVNNSIIRNYKDIKYVNEDEFRKINSEIYTNGSKLSGGIKYKLICKFLECDKEFRLRNSFSQTNINFFQHCGIRPIRYINNSDDVELVQALDINSCYQNILYNRSYYFPIQDGTEQTEIFNKDDKIEKHGFYFIEFKKRTDIINTLFGYHDCWILGYLINALNIKDDIIIKYKHVTVDYQLGQIKPEQEILKKRKTEQVLYTGYLGKYISEKELNFKCSGDEALAYKHKYGDDCTYNRGTCFVSWKEDGKRKQKTEYYDDDDVKKELLQKYPDAEFTDSNIEITTYKYLQSSGMYPYLAILNYARLQLYYIYAEIIKIDPNIKIKKIYTDSITFNHKLDDNIEMFVQKLNKKLDKNYGFTVKPEKSTYKWKHREIIATTPEIKDNIINEYKDINQILEKNQSFCINSKAGYGKSWNIKNKIIPYIEKQNKKYILASTTIENSKNLQCEVINSLIAKKDTHIKKIEETFKNIDYLIIDESSLLSMNLLNILQHIKNTTGIKMILCGDSNQCDFSNNNFMDTLMFYQLCDNNLFSINWHENARYSKDYDKFLNTVLLFKNGGRDDVLLSYIKSEFPIKSKDISDKKNDSFILHIIPYTQMIDLNFYNDIFDCINSSCHAFICLDYHQLYYLIVVLYADALIYLN